MTLRTVAELSDQPRIARQGARAHRLAVADIALHQHPQQSLRALVQSLVSVLAASWTYELTSRLDRRQAPRRCVTAQT